MKATITFEEKTEGNLDISFTFDPPIDMNTPACVVTKAVSLCMTALKTGTVEVEAPRIIHP